MTQTPTIGFFRMLPLECKKLKRTGCLPAVVLCGLFAAAFPLANMLVRPEAFTTLPGDPLSILADANWQMIAMLNILLSICLCCIMYHTEFADRGIQKSETLPVKAHLLFLGKGTILAVSDIVVILTECAALGFCALHWFPAYTFDSSAAFALLKFAGFLHALSSAVRICLGRSDAALSGSLRRGNDSVRLVRRHLSIDQEVSFMNFFSLIQIELQKIKRSKILLLLVIPVFMMWIPSILNADGIFDTQGIPITPESNFFVQGFMGMVWFMIPATLILCTVLLRQNEHTNHGILKMLALPISGPALCLAKFTVLILLTFVQMLLLILAYYLSAAAASAMVDYTLLLPPLFVFRTVFGFYLAAVPMAAVFWMIAVLIASPIFQIGIGLASIVPSVLLINTKVWFAYPMCYPFYLLMIAYGRAAAGVYETTIDWIPWIPIAALLTLAALFIACLRFGHAERK